jgi:hypothetical protein
MGTRTVTLIAAPLGELLPGRPVDRNQLPPDARAWADKQATNDNEMLTVLDGDHRVELMDSYDLYLLRWDDQHEPGRQSYSTSDDGVDAAHFAANLLDPDLSPHTTGARTRLPPPRQYRCGAGPMRP